MNLIIGGAYQGKLDYAIENYHISLEDVFSYTEGQQLDFSKKAVNGLHLFILEQIKNGREPLSYIQSNIENLREKIIICEDISCGVVPIDKTMRLWRECTGQCLGFLTRESDEVVRMFCGLGMKLK